jgi:hypothetical protein
VFLTCGETMLDTAPPCTCACFASCVDARQLGGLLFCCIVFAVCCVTQPSGVLAGLSRFVARAVCTGRPWWQHQGPPAQGSSSPSFAQHCQTAVSCLLESSHTRLVVVLRAFSAVCKLCTQADVLQWCATACNYSLASC